MGVEVPLQCYCIVFCSVVRVMRVIGAYAYMGFLNLAVLHPSIRMCWHRDTAGPREITPWFPAGSDLRDSGALEQAAPFRPVVYDPDFRPRDKAFLKVAKARDLPTGKIPVPFNAEITSFSDWTEL